MAQATRSTALGAPGAMVVLDEPSHKHHTSHQQPSCRPKSGGPRTYYRREDSNSSLEILPAEGEDSRKHRSKRNGASEQMKSTSDGGRPNSGSGSRKAPPVSRVDSAARRTPTPTKHVSLQAARRKEDNDEEEWDVLEDNHNNEGTYQSSKERSSSERNSVKSDWRASPAEGSSSSYSDSHQRLAASSSVTSHNDPKSTDNVVMGTAARETSHRQSSRSSGVRPEKLGESQPSSTTNSVLSSNHGDVMSTQGNRMISNHGHQEATTNRAPGGDVGDSDEFDTDLEDGESSSTEDTEEEPTKAPNELLMEFVQCVMEEDFQNARKLCTMILLYEPDNAEALKFQPLIEHKIQLEEELANQGTDSEEEDSDEDEDEDEDSEYDSSDEDSDDDEDEEEDEDGDDEEVAALAAAAVAAAREDGDSGNESDGRLDSGIASPADMV